jgi:hypothetical protein
MLNTNLKQLSCRRNQLTFLPPLNEHLEYLHCSENQLSVLPPLNEKLDYLNCTYNKLTCLPVLNKSLHLIFCLHNPIYEIIENDNLSTLEKNIIIKILNNFRYLYYSLKFKKRFRDWLWVKIREPKIRKIYHPKYLIENLPDEETDLDEVLNNW